MSGEIRDVPSLRERIGKASPAIDLKVIDHLDDGAVRWLAASPLMFIAFASSENIVLSPGGGAPGFAEVLGSDRLRVCKVLLDVPELAVEGRGFGALFLIPGIGEMLRVNGRVADAAGECIELAVEECYVHCAKALIRSDFWTADGAATRAPDNAIDFIAASRFCALATVSAQGGVDVSPKGDPAGRLMRASLDEIRLADRPGNRRADSFQNMLTRPQAALAALIPGTTRIAMVSGTVRLSSDAQQREEFTVHGKTPNLFTAFERPSVSLVDSASLQRAQLWSTAAPTAGIDPAAMLVAHVKLNRQPGIGARLLSSIVSLPNVMRNGLDRGYKKNLY